MTLHPPGPNPSLTASLAQLSGLLDLAAEVPDWLPGATAPVRDELSQQSRLAGAWGVEPVEHSVSVVRLLLVAAHGHLRVLIDTLRSNHLAPWTVELLARAALESLARSTKQGMWAPLP